MNITKTLRRFPFYKQHDSMDCGPACLRMVARWYDKSYSLQTLRDKCYIDKSGVSLKGIAEAAESIGFRSLAVKIPLSAKSALPSLSEAPLPAILHWNQNHFVVLHHLTKKYAWIADPGSDKHKLPINDFKRSWLSDGDQGIALLLEPGLQYDDIPGEPSTLQSMAFLGHYLKPHRKLLFQVFLGLLTGTVFNVLFPFITQSIVDKGIDGKDLQLITILLVGQLVLYLSQAMVRFIQSWILLHAGVRIGISLIADFLIKLMRLPMGFFDSKHTGDLMQRISDHYKIESFLTNSTLQFVLSLFNLVVFGSILVIYSIQILLIFAVASILYTVWILIFLKKRKEINYRNFQQMSLNQESLIEIIQGIQEIKLQGSQLRRRWEWASIQAKLFRTQMETLSIGQYQDVGALLIGQVKDLFITYLVAMQVMEGKMTLGMMLAIQYILGQINGPLQQLIGFIREAQDARISFDRLSEIHSQKNEENTDEEKMNFIPAGDIQFDQVSFRYTPINDDVLTDISCTIPRGKTTAIVGASGSGKTTMIKLLLGFYQPVKGRISVGGHMLQSISQDLWRSQCGVVMQDGFIFSDSIARNIAESGDYINLSRVMLSAHTANIEDFVQSLPLGYQTMIGARGNGLSQGQKQRLLIARAVYKNPEFIFFDEATNALDANNERVIIRNMQEFLEQRTAIIVAHRLSTVRDADLILVMDQGRIVEQGSHATLVALKGYYFKLIQNQLELAT